MAKKGEKKVVIIKFMRDYPGPKNKVLPWLTGLFKQLD